MEERGQLEDVAEEKGQVEEEAQVVMVPTPVEATVKVEEEIKSRKSAMVVGVMEEGATSHVDMAYMVMCVLRSLPDTIRRSRIRIDGTTEQSSRRNPERFDCSEGVAG